MGKVTKTEGNLNFDEILSSKCKVLLVPTGAVLGVCSAVGLHANKINQCFSKCSYHTLITDSQQ